MRNRVDDQVDVIPLQHLEPVIVTQQTLAVRRIVRRALLHQLLITIQFLAHVSDDVLTHRVIIFIE